MGRFDVTRVQAEIAGTQNYNVDSHVTTRTGTQSDVLTVSLGGIAIYLYDLAAVRAFAAGWNMAQRFIPGDLAELASPEPESTTSHIGAVVHVAGTPQRRRVNGVGASASPSGRPFVRVEVGALTVHALDATSVRSAAESWASIERLARRRWPEMDAFEEADLRERATIARRGSAAKRRQQEG